MQIINLGSGSKGNATVIESEGKLLLVDCGFSRRQMLKRFAEAGFNPDDLCGILVTHEHGDHIYSAEKLCNEFDATLIATAGTIEGGNLVTRNKRVAKYDQMIEHENFSILPLQVSHDTEEPCAFLIENDEAKSLFLTDVGTTDNLDIPVMTDLDYLYIEANHDSEMLATGPYPYFLKQRVSGIGGHLNNEESGKLIKTLAMQSPNLKSVMLAHLSDKNNHPDIALQTVKKTVGDLGDAELLVAMQKTPTDMIK
ncbi:MBL fold metallo-hydrolase [bacterium]|jgi:phosphoribosyl 1,2-cyclic phosphodiesterase|nr:MBL fold metallo-hydrolase [bacterium]